MKKKEQFFAKIANIIELFDENWEIRSVCTALVNFLLSLVKIDYVNEKIPKR
jgi:hypothetical protein